MNLTIDQRIKRGAGTRGRAGNGDADRVDARVSRGAEIVDVADNSTGGEHHTGTPDSERFALVADIRKEHPSILVHPLGFYERAYFVEIPHSDCFSEF